MEVLNFSFFVVFFIFFVNISVFFLKKLKFAKLIFLKKYKNKNKNAKYLSEGTYIRSENYFSKLTDLYQNHDFFILPKNHWNYLKSWILWLQWSLSWNCACYGDDSKFTKITQKRVFVVVSWVLWVFFKIYTLDSKKLKSVCHSCFWVREILKNHISRQNRDL